MVSLLLSSYVKADNLIELKNVESDALDLTIEQVGAKNTIQCYQDDWCFIKDSVTIDLKQVNTSTSTNTIEIWHIEDGGNNIRWGQGVSLNNKTSTTWLYDSDEGGGHYAMIDVHGANNTLVGYQQNGGDTIGHIFNSLIFSDNNDIWVRQKNNGQKVVKDCFETVNRGIFAFNQGLDKALFKPLAKGYRKLPQPIRSGTSNALNNLSNVVTLSLIHI